VSTASHRLAPPGAGAAPPPAPRRPPRVPADTARGVVLLVLAALLFGVMSFGTKLAGARLTGAEIAAVRFGLGLVVTLGLWGTGLATIRVPRSHLGLLILRGAFGGIAVVCFFTAIAHGSVGTATLLNFTSPAFTALFAWIFLRERVSPWLAVAFLVAGAGVALVWRGSHSGPLSLFGWQSLGLVSAVLAGGAITAIRGLRRYEAVTSWTVFLFFNAIGLLCAGPVAALAWRWPTPREWGFLVGLTACSVAGQILFTEALAYLTAAASGIIQQLTVVTAFALGALFLHEAVGGLQLAGAALTMVGVVAAARFGQPRPAGAGGDATSPGNSRECP
jgi:drug/metabolite transporter (DMT)-like permease